jgi:hypothetical protein
MVLRPLCFQPTPVEHLWGGAYRMGGHPVLRSGTPTQVAPLRVALIALAVLSPSAALAFDVRETTFEVYHTVDGEEVSDATTTVPMSPDDQTCWNWFIRSTESTGEVTFTERLVMPEAPESWGDPDEIPEGQVGKLILEDGGKIGISTRRVALDDGWFGHGWCILPGDPTGDHYVEVTIDGEMVHRFDFEVVPFRAEVPPAQTRVYDRTDRSGRFSL